MYSKKHITYEGLNALFVHEVKMLHHEFNSVKKYSLDVDLLVARCKDIVDLNKKIIAMREKDTTLDYNEWNWDYELNSCDIFDKYKDNLKEK